LKIRQKQNTKVSNSGSRNWEEKKKSLRRESGIIMTQDKKGKLDNKLKEQEIKGDMT
jgi:hypothetical protein